MCLNPCLAALRHYGGHLRNCTETGGPVVNDNMVSVSHCVWKAAPSVVWGCTTSGKWNNNA